MNYNPPYWFHKNIQFPDEEINQVSENLKKISKELLVRKYPMLSSYYFKMHQRPDKIWQKKYSDIVKDITKEVGLYSLCRYEFEYWSQYYLRNTGHPAHCHFDPSHLSFVHILKSPEKLFTFTDTVGNTFVPPEQNNGDLFVFPSWVFHEVKPNESGEERFVVAGNITITDMSLTK